MTYGILMRRGRAAVVVVALLGTMAAWSDEIFFKVYSDGWTVPIRAEAALKAEPLVASKSFTTNGITFNITYGDDGTGQGFDDPVQGADRKARVESALTTVAAALNETGELDVLVEQSVVFPGNTLAVGGTFFSSAVQFSNGSAFQRIQSGTKPFENVPEMFVQFDFTNNFYAGENPAGLVSGQTDLETVLLHEFTHGLGFLSVSDSSGISQIRDEENNPFPGVFTVWDSLMLRGTGSGSFNLFVGPSPNLGETFQGTPGDLVSNDLYFSGAESTGVFGGNPPVYAPSTFSSGSSLSHWDTGNVPFSAVMEHVIFAGEISRDYPDFERVALYDLGWSNVSTTPPPPPPAPDNTPFPPPPASGVPVGSALGLVLLATIILAMGIGLRRIASQHG